MKFDFRIDSENAAFSGGEGAGEVARLLRQTAERLEQGQECGRLTDYNGNGCGTWDAEAGAENFGIRNSSSLQNDIKHLLQPWHRQISYHAEQFVTHHTLTQQVCARLHSSHTSDTSPCTAREQRIALPHTQIPASVSTRGLQ